MSASGGDPEPSESIDAALIESLTEAQGTTYGILLSMDFDSKIALKAAQTHGANLERAAEYCIDPPPDSPPVDLPVVAAPGGQAKSNPEPKPEERPLDLELKVDEDEVRKSNLVHKAVFFNDTQSLRAYTQLKSPGLFDSLDHRGNTPLSLAARVGAWEAVHALLDRTGADPRVVLPSGWTAIHEAIVAKNENALMNLLLHQIQNRTAEYEQNRKELQERLRKIPDFSIELYWEVKSWIPFMSSIVSKFTKDEDNTMKEPFRIYKFGDSIRFDSKISGLTGQGISKGDLTFLYTAKNMLLINHDQKLIDDALRKFRSPGYEEIRQKIRNLLNTDEGLSQLCPVRVSFKEQKTLLGSSKTTTVDDFTCTQYKMTGLKMMTITQGAVEKREFTEYFAPKKEEEKEPEHTVDEKDVKIDMSICQKYPLKRPDLITVFECIAPASDDIARILEIFKLRFPDGFPVQLSFPVMPAISVQITFKNFKKLESDNGLFEVPSQRDGYRMKR